MSVFAADRNAPSGLAVSSLRRDASPPFRFTRPRTRPLPEPATRGTLKALGFSWNRTRGAWQHPGGVWKPQNRRIDPREVYGEEPLDQ